MARHRAAPVHYEDDKEVFVKLVLDFLLFWQILVHNLQSLRILWLRQERGEELDHQSHLAVLVMLS